MIKCGKAPYLECSGHGFIPLSAFHARIKKLGNKSIEQLYQAHKVFENGVTGLAIGYAKGRKAVNQEECHVYYSKLWDMYIDENPYLLALIRQQTGLSDKFGQEGHCCQATELWRIRNDEKRSL